MTGNQPSANLRVKLANYTHLAADVVHPNLQEEAWAMKAMVVQAMVVEAREEGEKEEEKQTIAATVARVAVTAVTCPSRMVPATRPTHITLATLTSHLHCQKE